MSGVGFQFDPTGLSDAEHQRLVNHLLVIHNSFVFGAAEFDYTWNGVLNIRCGGIWTKGLPIRITETQEKSLLKQLAELRSKDIMLYLEKQVDVVHYEGHRYILSDSGSRRIACNLRGKLICAKNLGCEYSRKGGKVRWQGQRLIHLPEA